ncbi:MAG: thioredoxin [Myxococcota bacterium]
MASANVFEFTDANFQSEVLDSQQPVLVDFWAAWCGPCRAIAPVIDQVADEYLGQLKVGKVDIDSQQRVAQQLRVTSIPALFIFKNGQEVDRIGGAVPKAKLVERVKAHL